MPANYGWISWILVLGVFYLFLIMPEQKKQKKMKAMLSGIKEGDVVLTRGGIYGRISSISDDRLIIESSPERTKLEIAKTAVYMVINEEVRVNEEEKKEEYREIKEIEE